MSRGFIQPVLYGLVGLVNAACALTVIFGAMALGFGTVTSNAIGYAVGLIISFFLNSRITFKVRAARATFIRFLIVAGGSYLANLCVVVIAIRLVESKHLAQILGVPVYTAVGYLANKYWAMKG